MKKLIILFLMLLFTVPAFASNFDEQRFLRNYAQILVVSRGFLFAETDIEYCQNKIWRIDGHTVHYRNGKIIYIGSEYVDYYPDGEICKVGEKSVTYDKMGRIDWLGNKAITYYGDDIDVFTVRER